MVEEDGRLLRRRFIETSLAVNVVSTSYDGVRTVIGSALVDTTLFAFGMRVVEGWYNMVDMHDVIIGQLKLRIRIDSFDDDVGRTTEEEEEEEEVEASDQDADCISLSEMKERLAQLLQFGHEKDIIPPVILETDDENYDDGEYSRLLDDSSDDVLVGDHPLSQGEYGRDEEVMRLCDDEGDDQEIWPVKEVMDVENEDSCTMKIDSFQIDELPEVGVILDTKTPDDACCPTPSTSSAAKEEITTSNPSLQSVHFTNINTHEENEDEHSMEQQMFEEVKESEYQDSPVAHTIVPTAGVVLLDGDMSVASILPMHAQTNDTGEQYIQVDNGIDVNGEIHVDKDSESLDDSGCALGSDTSFTKSEDEERHRECTPRAHQGHQISARDVSTGFLVTQDASPHTAVCNYLSASDSERLDIMVSKGTVYSDDKIAISFDGITAGSFMDLYSKDCHVLSIHSPRIDTSDCKGADNVMEVEELRDRSVRDNISRSTDSSSLASSFGSRFQDLLIDEDYALKGDFEEESSGSQMSTPQYSDYFESPVLSPLPSIAEEFKEGSPGKVGDIILGVEVIDDTFDSTFRQDSIFEHQVSIEPEAVIPFQLEEPKRKLDTKDEFKSIVVLEYCNIEVVNCTSKRGEEDVNNLVGAVKLELRDSYTQVDDDDISINHEAHPEDKVSADAYAVKLATPSSSALRELVQSKMAHIVRQQSEGEKFLPNPAPTPPITLRPVMSKRSPIITPEFIDAELMRMFPSTERSILSGRRGLVDTEMDRVSRIMMQLPHKVNSTS
jgi:hypothetical protein